MAVQSARGATRAVHRRAGGFWGASRRIDDGDGGHQDGGHRREVVNRGQLGPEIAAPVGQVVDGQQQDKEDPPSPVGLGRGDRI